MYNILHNIQYIAHISKKQIGTEKFLNICFVETLSMEATREWSSNA